MKVKIKNRVKFFDSEGNEVDGIVSRLNLYEELDLLSWWIKYEM